MRIALLLLIALLPVVAIAQDTDCPIENQVKLTFQSSPYPSLPGQSVRLDVFAESVIGLADPTGTVSLADADTDLGTFPLALGHVSVLRTFSTAGGHVIHAVYSGDYYYCGAVSNFGQAVDRITPTISLSSTVPASTFGTPLTFTAQIAPAAVPGVTGPAGPVQFFDSGTLIGAADLVSGKAAFTTAALAAGTHQISATLIGDPNWYSVRTTPIALTISPVQTATRLDATATTANINLMATVTAPGVILSSGSVQFVDTTANTVLGSASLPSAAIVVPISKIPAGHAIAAVYSGAANFGSSTSNMLSTAAVISATGTATPNLAPDEIASIFSTALAASTLLGTPPLTTSLGGTSVTVTDSTGTARLAALYLVSPTQINFVIPTSTATTGPATITISGAGVIPIQVAMAPVAPSLFNPGAQILRVHPDGSQTVETVTASPISLGPDPAYLVLYATGLRNHATPVTATIGTLTLPTTYAGPQPQFPGLDQVDILLPSTLQSAGKVNVTLTVDGQQSNPLPLTFQ